jgi:DNA repair protein RecN (Recombination protein N)
MLQSLTIRDFVIVDQLDLDFSQGLTVLTGETGAGKSILIDALSLALGARAESGMIRLGCEKTEISVSFFIQNNPFVSAWLEQNAIELDDGQLIFRRLLYQDGRSRAYLNGQNVTLQQLKDIGEMLVDIYSQNAHHSLLKSATQRDILDQYAGAIALAQQTSQQFREWQMLKQQREQMQQNAEQYQHELALLRDQCRELKQLEFNLAAWEALQHEHYRLSNATELLKGCEQITDLLTESELAATRQLNAARQQLQRMKEIDAGFNEAFDTLESGIIQVEESGRLIKRYLQSADLEPQRLAEVEARIQAVHACARKYRVRPDGLPELLAQSEQRMQELSTFADDGELQRREEAAQQAYQQVAQQVSALRAEAAPKLSQQITALMQSMALSGGIFNISLTAQAASSYGLEDVEFLVAGHTGVEPRPLSKVASGGELSRISLAIRVATASQTNVQTMIFDEVDVGIGGGVAEVVGKLLKQLSVARQALVITHLPQVAAQGQHHLRVSKYQRDNTTLSRIQTLDNEGRVEEIARMLGGVELTETTRKHAQEMLGY